MAVQTSPIAPCLSFDTEALEVAEHYVSIFPDSRIISVSHYGEAGREFHKREPGSVLTVEISLGGSRFCLLNGGPFAPFNQAISFQVPCDTQEEIDHLWEKLSQGPGAAALQCGWVKDKYGVSWQIFPAKMREWLAGPSTPASDRVMAAMMTMGKLDLETLRQAYESAG